MDSNFQSSNKMWVAFSKGFIYWNSDKFMLRNLKKHVCSNIPMNWFNWITIFKNCHYITSADTEEKNKYFFYHYWHLKACHCCFKKMLSSFTPGISILLWEYKSDGLSFTSALTVYGIGFIISTFDNWSCRIGLDYT